jgi:hypothetical protein
MVAKAKSVVCPRPGCRGVVVPVEDLGSVNQGAEYPCRKCWSWFVVESEYGAPIVLKGNDDAV